MLTRGGNSTESVIRQQHTFRNERQFWSDKKMSNAKRSRQSVSFKKKKNHSPTLYNVPDGWEGGDQILGVRRSDGNGDGTDVQAAVKSRHQIDAWKERKLEKQN